MAIIGAGASGTFAALQAARQGATVLLVEEGPWVGGMLTAAGVSAIDGNHRIAGGLWREFRDSLYAHYGGPEAVATGWVSNTLFEPAIGQRILRNMLRQEPRITLRLHFQTARFRRNPGYWSLVLVRPDVYEESLCQARVLIDATELGDIAHRHGVPRDVGMDARSVTSESFAPERTNDIIQDLTYVLTLQDYGEQADKTIPRPPGYDPEIFRCACDVADPSGQPTELLDCAKLLTYGRLPNHKYMINWPNCGNDHYLNLLGKNPEERHQGLDSAKVRSLRFLYFLQHELGYRNLGLAADEYPTTDGLPLIPYHRESGRIHGLVRFTVDDLLRPYDRPDPLYRTSIAVGDYPIDHHHKERPDAPDIDFIRIKAPAYGLPLGTLLPRGFPGLIVAEKSISVSNIVNGTTRLQPVVMGIGQAAGALAARAAELKVSPEEVPVRDVQQALLTAGAYLLPFFDVSPDDPDFAAIQRTGVTGLLRGVGVPYKWANQLWFYPDRPATEFELVEGLRPYYPQLKHFYNASGANLGSSYLQDILKVIGSPTELPERETFTRRELAVFLDAHLHLFDRPLRHNGHPQP